jgi:hypothetical protein
VRTTDAQVRKLMDEMQRHGEVGRAALRAGLSANTARKYLRACRLPSEVGALRTWRTRADPFASDWAELRARLVDAPELEATTRFEDLLRRKPDGYPPGQLHADPGKSLRQSVSTPGRSRSRSDEHACPQGLRRNGAAVA